MCVEAVNTEGGRDGAWEATLKLKPYCNYMFVKMKESLPSASLITSKRCHKVDIINKEIIEEWMSKIISVVIFQEPITIKIYGSILP